MKINLGIIFGGMSTEYEISIKSATSIINNLNEEKYNIFKIFIDKNGMWFDNNKNIEITNVPEYLKSLDIVFPVLHGLYGEDGTIQGMLEVFKIPYVGCKVLASSLGMDKIYSKAIFEKAKIKQAKYICIKKYREKENYILADSNLRENEYNLKKIIEKTKPELKYPLFIKPSNSGSSIGVNKAENDEELIETIKNAEQFDHKIIIEQGIKGREIECAVLGNSKVGVIASTPGEIISAEDFYSYDAKYKRKESKTLIPANLSPKQIITIQDLAKRAFLAIDGNGISRVDFFLEEGSNEIYINEINTMPGFTEISMYPKLFEYDGIKFNELIDRLIDIELNSLQFTKR